MLLSEDDFCCYPADDLDKDTMQLHIIADDRMSDSKFMPADNMTNKSGNFGAFANAADGGSGVAGAGGNRTSQDGRPKSQ